MKCQFPWSKILANQAVMLGNQEKILKNQEREMATFAQLLADDAQLKSEMDVIATGVTNLVSANKSLSDQLAAALAANDPAQLQAAADAAAALVVQGQAIVNSLPTPAPAPAPAPTP